MRVVVASEQPPVPVTVYVIVAVPAACPVTTPELFTVAVAVFELDQVPPETDDEKVVVDPSQTFWFPLNVPVFGGAVTVTVRVAVASAHPPVPATVYVIVVVPAACPVTTPELFTVAVVVFELDQVPPETDDKNVVVDPSQTFWFPLNVPAFGGAVTVTVLVAVASAHPPVPATVYVIVVVPAACPVTTPELFTVAVAVFELDQVPPETDDEKVVVDPSQTFWFPLNVPALGDAVTVTVCDAQEVVLHVPEYLT